MKKLIFGLGLILITAQSTALTFDDVIIVKKAIKVAESYNCSKFEAPTSSDYVDWYRCGLNLRVMVTGKSTSRYILHLDDEKAVVLDTIPNNKGDLYRSFENALADSVVR